MRVIFAGTPEFAAASLRALLDSGQSPVAVLTQPDRPAGRGRKLTPSPVKVLAQQFGVDVLQPSTLKDDDVLNSLKELQADVMVVAAYGLLLPQSVLSVPRVACVNVHASLLPRWRGAAPVQAAILAGDEETGISLMQMEAGLDTGPVYKTWSTVIGENETAGELQERLAEAGGKLLVDNLAEIVDGELAADAQNGLEATYAGKVKTADARIDWSESAQQLQRVVRAYDPVPGAWTTLDDERIKCWRATAVAATSNMPGEILDIDANGLIVACSDGAIAIQQLQRPGKKTVTAAEFSSQTSAVGKRFG